MEIYNIMKSFKEHVDEIILESVVDDLFAVQKKRVSILISRFQPIHLGHQKILNKMTRPLIVLIKDKPSKETPFPLDYQVEMIKKVYGTNIRLIISDTSYLPEIFTKMRSRGLEPSVMYIRTDKEKQFRKQVEDFNKKLNDPEKEFDVNFIKSPKDITQKKVRASILNNDSTRFRKMMPKVLWGEFSQMLKFLHKV